MAHNIEIKAHAPDLEGLLARALALPGAIGPETLDQDDTFFVVPQGRLKLREFADGSAELIAYTRPDTEGPKLSDYVRSAVPDAASLREALARALGELGRVRKRRRLVLVGSTRIHLDQVEGLGPFLELEVVLQPGQTPHEGEAIAHDLLDQLQVPRDALMAGAYMDALLAR
ncbi:MAG: class IV adenylate cyclase [Planctomycetes bacterium]|nr:class IV adenylate cyclase [Planctomycetota bacterium]HPF12864.1 class IV adenylate cyclase [Planctomycetota bacterium]